MDEPTSALDVESEAQVVASLFALMRGRTTLMVAHRLTTIRRVDKILVVEHARLTEMGARDDLLAQQAYSARVVSGALNLSSRSLFRSAPWAPHSFVTTSRYSPCSRDRSGSAFASPDAFSAASARLFPFPPPFREIRTDVILSLVILSARCCGSGMPRSFASI